MASLISIYVGGVLTLLIAFYHTQLYKKLNWSEEFDKIENDNAKIIYTINLALAILFLIIGSLSILYAKEFSENNGLAFGFSLSYSCFWIWRLIWQITYQKKGKGQNSTQPNISKVLIPFLIAACYIFPFISKTFS